MVIPVFNGLHYLAQTVDSVLAQDYPNLEVVLVDGGSTDDSVAWLRTQTDPRIRIHELPQGTTAATTWTTACERANGAFIKMMGQDDILRSDALTRQVEALQEHAAAGMACGLRDIIAADGSLLWRNRGLAGLKPGMNDGEAVLRGCYLQGTNVIGEPFAVLFRRANLLDALPWSDSRPLLLDLDLYTKVLRKSSLVAEPAVIGAFRVSNASWSTRLAAEQRSQFRSWQAEYEGENSPIPSTKRMRASFALLSQTGMRRGAYLWLRLRRRMDAHPLTTGNLSPWRHWSASSP